MSKVIIIGASTGMGKDLAKEFATNGWEVGITARRLELLEELSREVPGKWHIKQMDAGRHDEAKKALDELIATMGGVDVVVYNAGIGDSSGQWEKENNLLQINAIGFAAISNHVFKYFRERKQHGQIAGVSSVASQRGSRMAIGYCATKAFMSNYMEGQRQESVKKNFGITITDLRPGFIATPMTKDQKGMFWVVPSTVAAKLMYKAIVNKKDIAYIPGKWRMAAWAMSNVPSFLWNKV
jgi:short-subunit dehydrogenase